MANTINTFYSPQFKSTGTFGKGATNSKAATAEKTFFARYVDDTSVELSDAGLSALNKLQSDTVDNDAGGAAASDEKKLSAKAQNLLDKLREKYGNYDFIVSDNLDAASTVGSNKEYSVLFTTEELERMAEDDDYAQKVMGNVGKAVDILKDLSEKDLGDGVQFSQLSVSFDSDGNMKLFAQLEKLSADQKERLEAAKEKRAEQQKLDAQAEKSLDDAEPEPVSILFKSADVEADTAEGLLAKIFGIDWDNIAEEEAFI